MGLGLTIVVLAALASPADECIDLVAKRPPSTVMLADQLKQARTSAGPTVAPSLRSAIRWDAGAVIAAASIAVPAYARGDVDEPLLGCLLELGDRFAAKDPILVARAQRDPTDDEIALMATTREAANQLVTSGGPAEVRQVAVRVGQRAAPAQGSVQLFLGGGLGRLSQAGTPISIAVSGGAVHGTLRLRRRIFGPVDLAVDADVLLPMVVPYAKPWGGVATSVGFARAAPGTRITRVRLGVGVVVVGFERLGEPTSALGHGVGVRADAALRLQLGARTGASLGVSASIGGPGLVIGHRVRAGLIFLPGTDRLHAEVEARVVHAAQADKPTTDGLTVIGRVGFEVPL